MKIDNLTRQEWLDLHNDPSMISASQVSSILNKNSFCNAVRLWGQKMGHIETPDELEPMLLMGHAAEDPISKLYTHETGNTCFDPGEYTIHVHDDFPWLFATLDRTTFKDNVDEGAVECKFCTLGNDNDLWNEQDRGPLKYQIQLQIQMQCAGMKWGALAALVGMGFQFHTYEFERNDDFFYAILLKLREFRANCMAGERPETVEFDYEHSKLLKTLHPDDNGETVELPEDLVRKAELYTLNNAIISKANAENGCYKAQIMDFMGDNSYGDCGKDRQVKWVHNSKGNRTMAIKVPEIQQQAEYILEED